MHINQSLHSVLVVVLNAWLLRRFEVVNLSGASRPFTCTVFLSSYYHTEAILLTVASEAVTLRNLRVIIV